MNETEKYKKAKELLNQVNQRIKAQISVSFKESDLEKFGLSMVCKGFLEGKAIDRVILILRGMGCEWARKDHGGCTMCGHLAGSTRGQAISSKLLKKQFDDGMNSFDFTKYPMLCLYNGGSFFNENEIPKDLKLYIYKTVDANPHIKRFIIESRAEYISAELLDELEEFMPNTVVEIGVGLETVNNRIRDIILNKGNDTPAEFLKLGEMFSHRKTKLLIYVLIKPPFLTETESIEDAVSTVEFAHTLGADIVSLEAVSIQDFTLVSFLAEAGYYKTTWIWSILEIVKRIYHLAPIVRIGGFEYYPIPKEFVSNCSICNEKMIKKIEEFNARNDINVVNGLECGNHCDLQWKKELREQDRRDLADRIIDAIETIDVPGVLRNLKKHAHHLPGS